MVFRQTHCEPTLMEVTARPQTCSHGELMFGNLPLCVAVMTFYYSGIYSLKHLAETYYSIDKGEGLWLWKRGVLFPN